MTEFRVQSNIISMQSVLSRDVYWGAGGVTGHRGHDPRCGRAGHGAARRVLLHCPHSRRGEQRAGPLHS